MAFCTAEGHPNRPAKPSLIVPARRPLPHDMGSLWLYVFVALIAALTVSLVDAQTTQPPTTVPVGTTVRPTTRPPTNGTEEDEPAQSKWKPVAGIAIGFFGGFLLLGVLLMALLAYLRPQN